MRLGRLMVVVCGCGSLILAARWLAADTLVLRNGDTVEGQLVGADSDSIEFREKGFLGLGQVKRYDREDVRRIDIEFSGRSDRDTERSRGSYSDRGRSGDRSSDRSSDRSGDRSGDRSSDRSSGEKQPPSVSHSVPQFWKTFFALP